MMRKTLAAAAMVLFSSGCDAEQAPAPSPAPFTVTPIAALSEPWAMAFLPDGRLLVTQKAGTLVIVTQDGQVSAPLAGVPAVDYGGQGGLGDIALHPDFADNGMIYLSYAEAGADDTRGAAVARGQLVLDGDGGRLDHMQVIWRQQPKVTGRGHYGHRLLFAPDGHLFISSGERQHFDPAQDMAQN
ncbi:MAG: PQQ-dependent sugar dehydrogenase, partial [Alphaproteobacteria bacterium]